MWRSFVAGVMALGLSGCVVVSEAPETAAPLPVSSEPAPPVVAPDVAARNFRTAVERIEPVAEALCRSETSGINCDFKIQVDPRTDLPPNAFQSLDRTGRPLLTFTLALIADARNVDEIAFVMGHEAGHHIAQHLARQQQSATTGAILGGILASALGAEAGTIQQAQRAGATVGARRFSKDHELEADSIGTVITHRAGFDPVRGAAFFTRIPDPGDRFLGTHPPNGDRIATVRRVAAGL